MDMLQSDFYELGGALSRAIYENANPKYVKQHGDKILFNGFWRDGDKQNVCAWINNATWHDAKTGKGGGCKEFADVAFGMSLSDFLNKFGQNTSLSKKQPLKTSLKSPISIKNIEAEKIWQALVRNDIDRVDIASRWLSDVRGFSNPRQIIGSGFANLTINDVKFFQSNHFHLIKQRIELGPQLVVPIRGIHSDKIKNLFFRTISEVPRSEKSRLLTGAGGWSEPDGSPRAFGFPNLIHEFPNLVICEGMADYFASEYLLHGEEKYLPIGASNASSLSKWAEWLKITKYQGRVIWIYQLDVNQQGKALATQTGQLCTTEASKILRSVGIRSELFKWSPFLKKLHDLREIPRDLADVYSIIRNKQHLLNKAFLDIY